LLNAKKLSKQFSSNEGGGIVMLFQATGTGLDIGSKKIKLARVKKAKKGLELMDFASMPTPNGVIEQGKIIAPIELGKAISQLVNETSWKGQKVISALSSQEIFFDNFILPRMNRRESRKVALYQSSSFLPFPLDEAAFDIFFLREIDNSEGRKREVFFAAAQGLQVEHLKKVCTLAGLRLTVVEIPALALKRLWHSNNGKDLTVFLNIGYSYACFSVFQQQKLLFQRSFASFLEGMIDILGDNLLLEEVDMAENLQLQELMEEFLARVKHTLSLFQRQEREMIIGHILLCGGGAKLKGLAGYLSMILNGIVPTLNLPDTLALPAKFEQYRQELSCDFSVAIGLASRGVLG